MVHAMLRAVLPLTLLFTSLIGLIHARPYLDDGLDSVLIPAAGCRPPCWQGIRPGTTTAMEALDILDSHPWIDHIIITERYGATRDGFIGWAWNGEPPDPIDRHSRGAMWVENDIVRSVRIPSTIPFGALWLRLHRPQKGSFSLALDAQADDHVVIHYAAYPDFYLVAWNEVSCPLSLADFWRAPMVIQFTNTFNSELSTDYRLPRWVFGSPCG
jgi:hypothetical protein